MHIHLILSNCLLFFSLSPLFISIPPFLSTFLSLSLSFASLTRTCMCLYERTLQTSFPVSAGASVVRAPAPTRLLLLLLLLLLCRVTPAIPRFRAS